MNEMTQVLGIVAMEPKGEYSPTTYYEKLNVVTYGDFTYMAKEAVIGENPSASDKWQCIGGVADITVASFSNVSSMKSASGIINGTVVKTSGYYSPNDGGGGTYLISDTASNLYHQEELQDGLYANLIVENNTINIRQLGAKPTIYPDVSNKTDSKNYLLEYEALCTNNNMQYKLYIPNGLWWFSETLITRHLGVNIVGETNFSRVDFSGTVILPYADNQDYIWKIGGVADYSDITSIPVAQMVTQSNFDNLTFSTGSLISALKYKVNVGCLVIDRCDFMTLPNICIMAFNGNGLVVRSSWEITIGNLMFRNHFGFGTNQMLWDDVAPVNSIAGNISAFDINYVMSEGCDGPLLYSKGGSGASHNHIGHINIENGFSSGTQVNLTSDDEANLSSYVPIDLIKGFFRSLMIDSINFFDNNNKKTVDNGTTYYFRSLFADIEDATNDYNSRFNIVVGAITARMSGIYEYLVHSNNSYIYNKLTIGALSSLDTFKNKIFDMNFGMKIKIGTISNERGQCLYQMQNDAINYAGGGRSSTAIRNTDKNVLYFDELAPSFGHLVLLSDSGEYTANMVNSFDTSIKVRILYRNIGTSPSTKFKVSTISGGSETYVETNITSSTSEYIWSDWSNAISSDMNTGITIKSAGNGIAKIEVKSAS